MHNKTAIIFDLDGTLLDTLSDLTDAMNSALESFGLPSHNEIFYKQAVGDGIHLLAKRSLPKQQRTEEMTHRLVETMRQVYSQNWNNKTQPYANIPELLSALQNRHLQSAILSNKPDEKTKQCIAHYFPKHAFSIVMGASDLYPLKPHPAAVIQILKLIQVEKEHCLYVGDTNTDMQTARNAGLTAVGVSWGFRDSAELKEHGADIIVDTPLDLLNYI